MLIILANSNLDSKLDKEWKFFKNGVGQNAVTLPTDFEELILETNYGGVLNVHILKNQLTSDYIIFYGYAVGNGGQICNIIFACSNTSVKIYYASWNNSLITTTAEYKIYYR